MPRTVSATLSSLLQAAISVKASGLMDQDFSSCPSRFLGSVMLSCTAAISAGRLGISGHWSGVRKRPLSRQEPPE